MAKILGNKSAQDMFGNNTVLDKIMNHTRSFFPVITIENEYYKYMNYEYHRTK